jgi:hypothetical protein
MSEKEAKNLYLDKEVIKHFEMEAKKEKRSFSYIVNEKLRKIMGAKK